MNYKGKVFEYCMRVKTAEPVTLFQSTGPSHIPAFQCTVKFLDRTWVGDAKYSKKEAEQSAFEKVARELNIQ